MQRPEAFFQDRIGTPFHSRNKMHRYKPPLLLALRFKLKEDV